jgi:5-methylcytosine-specific restriction endonuclease McrA
MKDYKTCPKCNQTKPYSDWGKNRSKKDGLASQCKKCHAQKSAEWRKENPDEQKRRSREQFAKRRERENNRRKQRYWDNWELERQKARERYQVTAEKQRETSRQWRANNPEKLAVQNRSTRARRKNVFSEPYTKEQVLAKWGTDCHLCGKPIDLQAPRYNGTPGWEKGLHLDHVIPLINGGHDTLDNVKPAHGLCNLKKGKMKPRSN